MGASVLQTQCLLKALFSFPEGSFTALHSVQCTQYIPQYQYHKLLEGSFTALHCTLNDVFKKWTALKLPLPKLHSAHCALQCTLHMFYSTGSLHTVLCNVHCTPLPMDPTNPLLKTNYGPKMLYWRKGLTICRK